MIKQEQEFTPEELRQLDRLVDGELGDAERRQLLAALETRPDGWRRCALAFLEAQSWGRELGSFARPPAPVKAIVPAEVTQRPAAALGAPVVEPHSRSWWNASGLSLPWAMAATFLVAFGLAWMIRAPETNRDVAQSPAAGPTATNLATTAPMVRSRANPQAGAASGLDTVRLVMDDGTNGIRQVDLPVEEGAADDAWLTRPERIVPRELRQALERMGHHVDERRQFVPVRLNDGRQMVVPVDQVEFTPVSYQ